MAETLKLPSSTRFSRNADRSNPPGQRDLAVEQDDRMSLRSTAVILAGDQRVPAGLVGPAALPVEFGGTQSR
jgi:hypothetical protein